MKCIHCNNEIDNDSKFCVFCGKEVTPSAEPPKEAQPTTVPSTVIPPQTPVATYVNNGQPVQPKKSNTGLIVGIILGVVALLAVIIIVPIVLVFSKVASEIKNIDNPIEDYIEDKDEGKVVYTTKDPSGHEIKIVKDSVYTVKVDTSYLYDKAHELQEDAKMITRDEADKLSGTEKEKEATKEMLKILKGYMFETEKEIEEDLTEAGFTKEEIKFAREHVGVDWKEQAYIEALYYLASGGMSKDGLYDQLLYEGYSEEYAKYAVSKEDINYYEQAIYDALFSRYTSANYGDADTKEDAERILKLDGYTDEEIKFAIKTVYDEMEEEY